MLQLRDSLEARPDEVNRSRRLVFADLPDFDKGLRLDVSTSVDLAKGALRPERLR